MSKDKETMIEMFKGYIKYSDEEYKRIWKDAIIVVDTNILLNLYRYSEPARETMLNIFKNVKDRMWIPYQVGKEFFKNKDKVIFETLDEYDKLLNTLLTHINKAKEEVKRKKDNRLKAKEKINDVLDKDIKQIEQLLKTEQKEKKQILSEDKIEKIVLEIFNNNIGIDFSEDESQKVREEGIRRKNNDIPPGYKDKEKEENGDYYIFYSIIQKSKENAKDIIFITDDEKEDWFNKYNGENHGGRNELLDEFYHETGQLLLMYTTDGFVKAYNKNIDKKQIDKKIINEFKNSRIFINEKNNTRNFSERVLEEIESDYLNFIVLNNNSFEHKSDYDANIKLDAKEEALIEAMKENRKFKEYNLNKIYSVYLKSKIRINENNSQLEIRKIYSNIRKNINKHIVILSEVDENIDTKLINRLYVLKKEIEQQLRDGHFDYEKMIYMLDSIIRLKK